MKKIIVGNLKMNLLNAKEREQYFVSFKTAMKGKKFVESKLVLCPPFVHLEQFVKKLSNKTVSIGAQNVFWEEKGSFTGEVSAKMVKDLGVGYVILGHSERRKNFQENDQQINLKIQVALKNGLVPIVCIGENGEEKKAGNGAEVMMEQLKGCFAEINKAKMEKVIICYEPVWAISSNNPDHLPSANEIMSAKLVIKKFLADNFGIKMAESATIIYGGSVAPDNVKETCLDSGMAGALVGKESLTPAQFLKIVETIDKNI